MAKASGFVYRGGERTVESVSRKSQQGSGLYDSFLSGAVQLYKPKEGECTVRILPPTWEDPKWGDGWDISIYLHYNIGPDNGTYLCLDKMKGETCPICEARHAADDPDEKDQLRPSTRQLAWCIDRDNEKAGPLIWSLPITLFREVNARSIDKKSNTPILVDDPEEGYDILFTRTGAQLKTKYTAVEVNRDPSPIQESEKLQARWLEFIQDNPLPDALVYFDAEHIEKVLFGKVERKRGRDAEEEEAPRRSSRASRRSEPEPEEEEATPRRGRRAEPEEEPAPRRGRRAEPEEDVEEDPPPRSSRRGRAEPEEEEAPPPRNARRRALLDDEEPPFDPDEKPSSRRGRAAKDEEPDETVASARRSLDRLKPSGRR